MVYSGRSAKLLDPIFKRFEAKTGVKLKVRNGKSDELANRLAREGSASDCDLIILQESGYLEVLGNKGFLAKLSAETTNRVSERFRGTENHWSGISGRARVLVYSTKMYPAKNYQKPWKH